MSVSNKLECLSLVSLSCLVMFVSKASGAPDRCLAQVGSNHAYKH